MQALEIMFDKNNDLEVYSIEFFNDKSSLLFKVNFTEILENIAEILEYNM